MHESFKVTAPSKHPKSRREIKVQYLTFTAVQPTFYTIKHDFAEMCLLGGGSKTQHAENINYQTK